VPQGLLQHLQTSSETNHSVMATPLLSYTTSANISMKSILAIIRQGQDP
jgi:hypothetical protein